MFIKLIAMSISLRKHILNQSLCSTPETTMWHANYSSGKRNKIYLNKNGKTASTRWKNWWRKAVTVFAEEPSEREEQRSMHRTSSAVLLTVAANQENLEIQQQGKPIKENWLNEWKSIHSKDTNVKPLRMVWLALTLALTWRENDNILLNTK